MPNPKNNNKAQILIVDDIPENLQILGKIVSKLDVKIYAALSGKQALQIVSQTKPDLILLDISMPEMDGYEVCEKLKENEDTAALPVIFLTARNQMNDIIKGFETGAVDYITKPFNSSELLQRIRTHLELKTSKDIIQSQKNKLQELNDTKDKIFSIIAHDLKGPFNALIGLSDLLLNYSGQFDEERKETMIKSINQAAVKGNELISNLLAWARSQTGHLKLKPEKANMRRIAESVISLLNHNALEKNISLHLNLNEEHTVFVDIHTIETVFRNLISNAIKFTDNGGQVTLSSQIDNDKIIISIHDNGIGIPEETLKDLFSLSGVPTSPVANGQTGTGLGLILCKDFIEKNGGEIWAESELKKGSIFYFSLPLKQNE